jgi:hypothetical protein
MIPLWISGGYPPGITRSNDAGIFGNGLPEPYGHLIFQTAQVFTLWNMLSKSIKEVFMSIVKPWVGHKIGEVVTKSSLTFWECYTPMGITNRLAQGAPYHKPKGKEIRRL